MTSSPANAAGPTPGRLSCLPPSRAEHDLDPLQATRTHIEVYARELEQHGRAAATVRLKLTVIAGWYHYLVDDQLLEHSPAMHVRRPRAAHESTRLGLDRTSSAACWFTRA